MRNVVPYPTDIPPLFSRPPEVARVAWSALRKRLAKLDGLTMQLSAVEVELVQLRESALAASLSDAQRLGAAIAGGQDEPEPEAPALDEEIKRLQRRSAALLSSVTVETEETGKVIERSKTKWAADVQRRIADKAAGYRAAVAAMAEAREALVNEVLLSAWLARFPEPAASVQTARVPADPSLDAQGRSFAEVLGDLLRDSEQLPEAGPVQTQGTTAFDRRQAILEHVDAAGGRDKKVYRGGSPGQHAAWETLARIKDEVQAKDERRLTMATQNPMTRLPITKLPSSPPPKPISTPRYP